MHRRDGLILRLAGIPVRRLRDSLRPAQRLPRERQKKSVMLQETDIAVVTVDLPEYGLKAGDVGTVALVHGRGGYEVEFMTLDGETVAVTSLEAAHVRPVARRDVAHVRRIQVSGR